MKINNKIRYRSIKNSSPMTQFKRYLLGRNYQNRKREIMMPNALRQMFIDAWKEEEMKVRQVSVRKITREQLDEVMNKNKRVHA